MNQPHLIAYYVFRQSNSCGTVTVIMEDGGVASLYNPDKYYRTDLYQDRLNQESKFESVWDELAEGKMYCKDWDGKESPLKTKVDDEMILDLVNWLFLATEKVEFVKHEMGELNEESFNKVLSLLKF